jgi:hypothetical protein
MAIKKINKKSIKRKVSTKKRWYPKKSATGVAIETPIEPIATIIPEIQPTKRIDEMSYSELAEKYGVPKTYDIFRSPVRNEKAYAVGVWLAKRKIKRKNRLQPQLKIRCADCIRYIKLYPGQMGCEYSMAKIPKTQSMRHIDCVFYIPKTTPISLRKIKPNRKSRSEYHYDYDTPTCPQCGSYMELIGGQYTCAECDL